ncbi:MAG: pyruvate ferredoxin oxidoreductase [Acidobacteria bacterium]|nr:pyruvate ferredoxin oxidoreductase [Acidobacteriota bacterium]
MKVIEGTHAISYAVQRSRTAVIAAYPITPSSGVVELLAEMCADGRLSSRFIAVESEHSALAACAGASQVGLRAFTATSSHGLAYMHEMLHWCAGARLPVVLANVNRALGAPWNIFVDQTDSLSQRDTGWIQYYCEDSQEVLDTIIQAFRVAEGSLLPAMVCLDAFFLSHTSEPVSIPDQDLVDRFLPPYTPAYALSVDDPRAFGGMVAAEGYLELRARIEHSMRRAQQLAAEAAREYGAIFGRSHPLVEMLHLDDAEIVLVTSGTVAGTARTVIEEYRAQGIHVGMAKIHLFRPFPFDLVRIALGRARKVAVFDRNISFGCGGIMASEIRAALCNIRKAPTVFSFVGGLGGCDVTPDTIREVVEYTRRCDAPEQDTMWVGLPEESRQ